MSDAKTPKSDAIQTQIWQEHPEPDNPYATRSAFCRGYDVYGQMLGRARWVEMLFLLFRPERPSKAQADMLEDLAVALANPGPRDASVHAAMCGGVCGSTAASSLMAALAVGAGQYSGSREVFLAMQNFQLAGNDLDKWQSCLLDASQHSGSIWPQAGHVIGFDPHGQSIAGIVLQTLEKLAQSSCAQRLAWLKQQYVALEGIAQCPMTISMVAAAALLDLGFNPEQGEMLYLLLRLPGAAAHALEQRPMGYQNFPFGQIELQEVHHGS